MLQRTTPLLTESIARGSVPNPIQRDTPLSSKLAAAMQSTPESAASPWRVEERLFIPCFKMPSIRSETVATLGLNPADLLAAAPPGVPTPSASAAEPLSREAIRAVQ